MRGRVRANVGTLGAVRRLCGEPRVGGFRVGGCQMRHPPIQACGASGSVAPAPSEYMHNLNEPLMCIVFVPVILPYRAKLHHSLGTVAENLCMICP